ncbi:MAG TPA: hypothetical protein VHG53_06425 [Candidatus Limnocylindria bacterium]|nr:hypothetical protein [Candidatus Limnocylindria bacterium]
MFEAWANAAHTLVWVYEETPPRAVHRVVVYDDGSQPIRLDGLSGAGLAPLVPAPLPAPEQELVPGAPRSLHTWMPPPPRPPRPARTPRPTVPANLPPDPWTGGTGHADRESDDATVRAPTNRAADSHAAAATYPHTYPPLTRRGSILKAHHRRF